MKRKHTVIEMYDYTSKEEFEKHEEEMRSKGYRLIEKTMFRGIMPLGEVTNDEKWKYTACFLKSDTI